METNTQGTIIEQCWARMERHLEKSGADISAVLYPGATEGQIDWAESMLEIKLPDDFLEFYKIHNGQRRDAPGIIDGEELMSLERIVEKWFIWKNLVLNGTFEDSLASPDEGVQEDWFNLSWIPFTYDGSGNHLCLDLAPAPRGYRGQVIRIWHDDAGRFREASSFVTWVTNFVHDMDGGLFE